MRIVMISGYRREDNGRILKARREARVDGFVAKPFQIEAIARAAAGEDDGNWRP
jgi:hypothetical protein